MDFKSFVYVLGSFGNYFKELSPIYFKNVAVHERATFQLGKVFEEVGEFVQAVYAHKSCNGTISYPFIRGTIESEAADVVLACALYVYESKLDISVCRYTEPVTDDTYVVISRMLDAAGNGDVRRILSTVFFFAECNGFSLLEHTRARIEFNRNMAMKEIKERRSAARKKI